ncbi:universal stress protein [Nonomuraea guangzhouensis]|uniref:Universal stress protein n=1 Tax=Nonomuraea guangzhouensis TaxID=1291555 RepID=A0ABW4GXK0_9ACTN|nr:universal stress protein [Nonomuraea guangzhouensis]
MDQALPSGPRVVVGVDDSPGSRWALAWAIGEARLRRAPLLAVHVSRAPIHPIAEALPYDYDACLEEEARSTELIAALFDDVAGGVPGDLQVVCVARLGEPWHHLVGLARQGDLLVLGRGRRHWLSRLFLVSTRRYCTRNARATLVVVPPASAPDHPGLPAGRIGRRLRRPWMRHPPWQ